MYSAPMLVSAATNATMIGAWCCPYNSSIGSNVAGRKGDKGPWQPSESSTKMKRLVVSAMEGLECDQDEGGPDSHVWQYRALAGKEHVREVDRFAGKLSTWFARKEEGFIGLCRRDGVPGRGERYQQQTVRQAERCISEHRRQGWTPEEFENLKPFQWGILPGSAERTYPPTQATNQKQD